MTVEQFEALSEEEQDQWLTDTFGEDDMEEFLQDPETRVMMREWDAIN